MSPQPAKKPRPALAAVTAKRNRAEYHETAIHEHAFLRIPEGAEIQVLDVRRREGNGMDVWENVWHYVLIWR